MIKDENNKWYPVKHHQEPCCVSVEVREWDLVKILEEHIDICEIQSESYIFKRLIINSKILDQIPYQYSLSDFEITVENPRGFCVEKNISNCELWIDVFSGLARVLDLDSAFTSIVGPPELTARGRRRIRFQEGLKLQEAPLG